METLPESGTSPDVLQAEQERMIERGRLLVDSEHSSTGFQEAVQNALSERTL